MSLPLRRASNPFGSTSPKSPRNNLCAAPKAGYSPRLKMSQITFELILIAVLLVANGIFAMAEIALVSARKARLKTLADEGASGAKLALDLANSPGKFLSTVQVGITLVGVLAGAVGGANIADKLAHYLTDVPVIGNYAHIISMLFVVSIITYLSVIIGELVPKRLALNNPERIASILAGPMNWLSKIASPLVNLLNHSSDLLMTSWESRSQWNLPSPRRRCVYSLTKA